MYTWILVFLLCSWKIETLFLKWKYKKLQIMQLEVLIASYSEVQNKQLLKLWDKSDGNCVKILSLQNK